MQQSKRVAIIQSNYIPWKGYFDIINMVDDFVIFDEVQYTKRDWRNRNLIKTEKGLKWLSIPLNASGDRNASINQMTVANQDWRRKHWEAIVQNYSAAPFFFLYSQRIKSLYLNNHDTTLSNINYLFIKEINAILGINTKLLWSNDYKSTGQKSSKLINLCKAVGASIYLSGISAKVYIDESMFNEAGIELEWMDYNNYPEYQQLFNPFSHQVSVLDLIFNVGPMAPNFMKSFQ